MRPADPRDLDALVRHFADPEPGRRHPADLAGADAVRALVAGGDLLVVERNGELAGTGRFRTAADLPGGVLECEWQLARGHRDPGLADDVVAELLRAGFARAGAVFTLVDEADPRTLDLAARVGFVDVGGGRRHGTPHRVLVALPAGRAGVHHVELWVPDLAVAEKTFGWLFQRLGWHEYQRWDRGLSWRRGESYVVVEDSPARTADRHDRTAPGLNHLALHAGTRADVDRITAEAPDHGWRLMFADRHPHAGGPDHYAAYLENAAGFEVELVARS